MDLCLFLVLFSFYVPFLFSLFVTSIWLLPGIWIIVSLLCNMFSNLYLMDSETSSLTVNYSYLWEEWKERRKETSEEISSRFHNLRFVSLEVLPLLWFIRF